MASHAIGNGPKGNSNGHQIVWRASHQKQIADGYLGASEKPVRKMALSSQTIRISPNDLIKRHIIRYDGFLSETLYAPAAIRVELQYEASLHLLVLYERGVRRQGETVVRGLPPSMLRCFAKKMTFVPAGLYFREWHETSTPAKITYLYLDTVSLARLAGADATYAPKVFFDDNVVWQTADKLRNIIEKNEGKDIRYLEALANVLAHELSDLSAPLNQTTKKNRGGLAGWQIRVVTNYIEHNLKGQASLATMARLVRLSEYHFCRAFTQSFNIPPHRFLVERRIQRAKALLSTRTMSISEASQTLGYHHPSSFTGAFRKITGQTPRQFQRNSMPEERSAAEIMCEYGPFPGVKRVNGVTYDGKRIWFASGDRLNALDPNSGNKVGAIEVAAQAGTAFDGRYLFQLSGDRIQKIDPNTGRVLTTIPVPGGGWGLAWFDGALWMGQYRNRKIRQLDAHSGVILRTIECDRFVTGVTWVDGDLWHATLEGDESDLRRIDPQTGEVLESLEMPRGVSVSGLEADGGDRFFCGGENSGKVRAVRRPKRRSA